jgi:hypothetical protein
MTKKQYRTPKVMVGRVKQSIAAIAWRWSFKNVSQRLPTSWAARHSLKPYCRLRNVGSCKQDTRL